MFYLYLGKNAATVPASYTVRSVVLGFIITPTTAARFTLDLALVQFHANTCTGGHRNHPIDRFQRAAEEELVDLIPLDQIFEDRTQRWRLRRDELRRCRCRVAMWDQHQIVDRGQCSSQRSSVSMM